MPAVVLAAGPLSAQAKPAPATVPPLPDSAGWGVHVLAAARDPGGTLWVGTYGQGIYRLPAGGRGLGVIRHDTTATSISMDFVQAIAFGPRGEVWYGTVGNGWGLSTRRRADLAELGLRPAGPEWQYVIPGGIAIRGDTTVVATADGLQITTDDGAHWTAIGDAVGPPGARSGRHGAAAARQRVRPPARAGPPRLERDPRCAATSGCVHTAEGWRSRSRSRRRPFRRPMPS